MNFVFTGNIPTMGNISGLKATNRITGKQFGGETNFNGGDPWLQYRFWNQAENGYNGSELGSDDAEIVAEEEAFLGLENLFRCRKECKADLGGASNLRDCIRTCKGKGLRGSALKTKEAETADKVAESLKLMAQPEQPAKSSSTMVWVIVGIVAVIGISLLIYFLTRNKAVPVAA